MRIKEIANCQNCGAECKSVINLGRQPICNKNLKDKKEFRGEKKYPLRIVFCPSCYLVQQAKQLPTDLLFDAENFNYLSSSSKDVVSHYEGLANTIMAEHKLKEGDYVLDIASNDGVFLKPLKEKGIKVLGCDPAKTPAKMANEAGIPTIDKDFATAQQEIKERTNGQLKVITAFDVLAHTGDINGFLEKLKDLMVSNPNAIFISQSHYLPNLIEKCEFDTMYGEHQRFYTITSLNSLLVKYGINIYDAHLNDFYGGSFIAYASLGQKEPTKRLKGLMKAEKKYSRYHRYVKFRRQVKQTKKEILAMLNDEKQKQRRIIGIGQPMKSAVLLNYCNIKPDLINFLTERNQLKIGTFAPGTHQAIISDDEFFKEMASTANIDAVILSWNMKDTIMKGWREKGFKGNFIIPLPKPEVVAQHNV